MTGSVSDENQASSPPLDWGVTPPPHSRPSAGPLIHTAAANRPTARARATLQSRMKQAKGTRRVPNAGSWKPGQSGNPHGRPRTGLALAERIRERLDPDVLVDIALRVADDKEISDERKLAALSAFGSFGYQRSPVQLDVHSTTAEPELDLSMLTTAELERIAEHHAAVDAILERARARPLDDPRLPEPSVPDDDEHRDTASGTPELATPRDHEPPEAA